MLNFFFLNPNQHQHLRDLQRAERDSARKLGRAEDEHQSLQQDLDRLTLACAAMWSLLKEHGHTEEELLARMEELDQRDGRIDGKLALDAVVCAGCGRKSRGQRRACLYCGKPLPRTSAFGIEP